MADTYQSIEKVITQLKKIIAKIDTLPVARTYQSLSRELATVRRGAATIEKDISEGTIGLVELDKQKDNLKKLKNAIPDLAKDENAAKGEYDKVAGEYKRKLAIAQRELTDYATGKSALTKGSKDYEKKKSALKKQITCLKWKLP
jgi:chromosome segregation ATPase